MKKDYKKEQQLARDSQKPRVLQPSFGSNRAQRRSKLVDRTFTKRGYFFGTKKGSKIDGLIHHLAKRSTE